MDLRDAIDRILDLGEVRLKQVEGRIYSERPMVPVPDPSPKSFTLHSLTGVALYLQSNRDHLVLEALTVWVESHQYLSVVGALTDPWLSRNKYMEAIFEDDAAFPYDEYQPQEKFVVLCQTSFTQTDALAQLLKLAGNIRQDGSLQAEDNGVTQRTTAKTGVALVEEVSVQPRWKLAPYATWPELAQPEREFILRLRKGREGAPELALFEVGDSQWKVSCRAAAVKWLEDHLPSSVVVLG